MDYELFHNNIDGGDYIFVLIDASVLQKYFDDYHSVSDLNYLKRQCKLDPAQDWIRYGNNLPGFIVPSIRINEEDDVTITDGRHRVLWMMSKKMQSIPVAMTHPTRKKLEAKGIDLKDVTIFNMPCSTYPQKKDIVKIDHEKEVKSLISRLKKKPE
ncbi:hypothetical protein [Morganella psychrotolerans]|uniref:hypothetical protein n=1 Tax=Morganella psychrotolerans TaxID=368603 RepID=UPI0039B0CEF0